jgi:hypothetical protein
MGIVGVESRLGTAVVDVGIVVFEIYAVCLVSKRET